MWSSVPPQFQQDLLYEHQCSLFLLSPLLFKCPPSLSSSPQSFTRPFQLSKTYKCTLNMDYGKKKAVTKKKKDSVKTDEKKSEEKTSEDTGAAKKDDDEEMIVDDAAKPDDNSGKKKDVDKSVRLFHDDTFKGLFLSLLVFFSTFFT